jgi:fumarate hydratase class II
VAGLEANAAKCESNIENSLALATALAPVIGYDKAAQIAKRASESNQTVRQIALEMSGLNREQLDLLLDAKRQTQPNPAE